MLHRMPPWCMKCGKLHFIVSSTLGQPAWTSLRSRFRTGCANAADLSIYASIRGSFFVPIMQFLTWSDRQYGKQSAHHNSKPIREPPAEGDSTFCSEGVFC